MITKTRSVFYCEHCKKHGLSRAAMGRHESKCTLNPARVCRWHDEEPDTERWVDVLRSRPSIEAADIEWIERETDGCPACMLAALRQCGLDYHCDDRGHQLWDYDEQVRKYREAENYEAQMDEIRDIERSWL